MQPIFLLYGAVGYTGELIARAAVQQGLRPLLAGRSEQSVSKLANELGLDYRVFTLENPADIEAGLADVQAVLNCAGPFTYTSRLLARACIQTRTHYLDLAGEVPEFQELATLDAEAKAASVMLLPGVGFGIVPSDCLALYLKSRLPSATQLSLAFHALGGVSRGTLLNLLKDIPHKGVIRRNGNLVPTRAGVEKRTISFDQGSFTAVTNPWRGDVFTAYYSTGIPTIKAYTVFPGALRVVMAVSTPLKGILSSATVQNVLKGQMRNQPTGPTEQERSQGQTLLWGEVTDDSGRKAVSRLIGPEAYDFTVITAIAVVEQVLKGNVQTGFCTPAQVYGADFVLGMPDVTRSDESV